MTVYVHSMAIICFKFLFVDRLGPTATLKGQSISIETLKKCCDYLDSNEVDSKLRGEVELIRKHGN